MSENYTQAKTQQYNLIGTALRSAAIARVSGLAGGWYEATAGLDHRNSVLIHNSGTATVFITTGSNIPEVSGVPLPTGEKLALDITEDIVLYVCCSGAEVHTVVMELD